MFTFTPALPFLAFPWEVDTLDFGHESAEVLSVRVTYCQEVIYEEDLYFDLSHQVRVESLASLIIARSLTQAAPLQIAYKTEEDQDYLSLPEVTVLPCRGVTTAVAEDFVDEQFLSLLGGPKHTAPDGRESLSLYTREGGELLTVEAHFVTEAGESYVETYTESGLPLKNRLCSHLLEMRSIARRAHSDEDHLVRVVASVGVRRQEYILHPALRYSLRFRNLFQCEDVVYFTELEYDAKPERTTGALRGCKRALHVKPSMKIKGTTFPLFDGELEWAEAAANALHYQDDEGRDVVVTEASLKYSTSPQDMPQLTLTWEPAQRSYRLPHRIRTFDSTFDNSFG